MNETKTLIRKEKDRSKIDVQFVSWKHLNKSKQRKSVDHKEVNKETLWYRDGNTDRQSDKA